jgi:phosphate ABC transporter permease protein PstC
VKQDKLIGIALAVVALSAVSGLALITLFIFKEGLPILFKVGLREFLLSTDWQPVARPGPEATPVHFGILAMIAGSLVVTIGAIVVGVGLGLSCAIVLTQFCPRKVVSVLKPAIELLAGIPSVVFGFIGMVVLCPFIMTHLGGNGQSVLAASIVLGIMVLPTITSISVDALQAVPRAYYEGSIALGATQWQTTHRVMLKAARSGIVAAVILGMGRAIGETMAVIMVAGNAASLPKGLLGPAKTLTATIALEMGDVATSGDHRKALFAAGVVLFVIIMILNTVAMTFSRRQARRRAG